MFRNMLAFVTAVLEDQLTDDTILIYELVDVVRDLFLCHPDLLDVRLHGKLHPRVWLFLKACQRFSVDPCQQKYVVVVHSWLNLTAREKRELRKVAKMSGWGERFIALLELGGCQE